MTTLTMTLPNAPHRQIIIRLGGVATGVVPVDDADNVLTSWTVRTNEDGEASIVLPATADITPADTYYVVTVDQTSPTAIYHIELPDVSTVDLSDESIWIIDPDPPNTLPAAASGNAGDVPQVDATGSRYDLGPLNATNVSVTTGTMPNLEAATPPSSQKVSPYLTRIDSTLTFIGTLAGTALANAATAQATADGAQAGSASDAGLSTKRFLRIGGEGGGHYSGAFTTPNLGDEFTTGFFAICVIRPIAPGTNAQDGFAEILTQTHDGGLGSWDNFEWALRWSKGRPLLFFEWTEEGGSSELVGPSGGTGFTTDVDEWSPPVGQWSCIAVDLAFNVSGQWRGRHLRQVFADEDLTLKGLKWEIVHETTGATGPTEIDTGVTEDWAIGAGVGNTHLAYLAAYNGSAGAEVFALDAADATVSDEIDDSQGNTWTAGALAFVAQDVQPFDVSSSGGTAANNVPFHDIACWQWWHNASGTTPTRAQNSARYGAGYLDVLNSTSVTTTGHWIEWRFGADAGTWTLSCINDKQSNSGTWTITVDGVNIESMGVADSDLALYNATTQTNVITEFTGLVIPTNGIHTIRFTSTANGAGGNSGGRFTRLGFRRTA